MLAFAVPALAAACGGGSDVDTDIAVEARPLCIRCFGNEDRVAAGSPIVHRFVVRNLGSSTSDTVSYEVVTGPNLTLTKVSCVDGRTTSPCQMSGTTQFTSLPIQPGSVLEVVVETVERMRASFTATVELRATEPNDRSPGNDLASAAFTVYRADLAVSYTVDALTPPGRGALFVLTITNNGPDPTYWNVAKQPTFSSGVQPAGVYLRGPLPTIGGYYLEVGQSVAIGYTVPHPGPAAATVSSTYSLPMSTADLNPSNDSETASTVFAGG